MLLRLDDVLGCLRESIPTLTRRERGANCWSGYRLSILAVIPTICCERSSVA